MLNEVARSVVDQQRGRHPEYVFTYEGHRLSRMLTTAWKKARQRVGLPQVRVHDLKHTFGRRLRAANVSLETRKVLLGHASGDITTHYSAAELSELLDAVAKIVDRGIAQAPTLSVIRRKRNVVGKLSESEIGLDLETG